MSSTNVRKDQALKYVLRINCHTRNGMLGFSSLQEVDEADQERKEMCDKYKFPQNMAEGKERKGWKEGTDINLTEGATVKDNNRWCEGQNKKGTQSGSVWASVAEQAGNF